MGDIAASIILVVPFGVFMVAVFVAMGRDIGWGITTAAWLAIWGWCAAVVWAIMRLTS